ncbi:MAG TPA: UPF0236 family protein [Syntrophomonadaceae bacterium]|nr:UPF0236 family protein [Syntrophomonadaceae bacterium]
MIRYANYQPNNNQYETDYNRCSAEGHVSHILSSRLSSRPLGWCKTGVDQMARLRTFEANGGIVYDPLMEKKIIEQKENRRSKIELNISEKRKTVRQYETFGNLAILNIGKNTTTAKFLRSIRTS